jgi:hypothetical protein
MHYDSLILPETMKTVLPIFLNSFDYLTMIDQEEGHLKKAIAVSILVFTSRISRRSRINDWISEPRAINAPYLDICWAVEKPFLFSNL